MIRCRSHSWKLMLSHCSWICLEQVWFLPRKVQSNNWILIKSIFDWRWFKILKHSYWAQVDPKPISWTSEAKHFTALFSDLCRTDLLFYLKIRSNHWILMKLFLNWGWIKILKLSCGAQVDSKPISWTSEAKHFTTLLLDLCRTGLLFISKSDLLTVGFLWNWPWSIDELKY